jgi:hypothetical protein
MTDRDAQILAAAGNGPAAAQSISDETGYSITTVGLALRAHGWTRRYVAGNKVWFAPALLDDGNVSGGRVQDVDGHPRMQPVQISGLESVAARTGQGPVGADHECTRRPSFASGEFVHGRESTTTDPADFRTRPTHLPANKPAAAQFSAPSVRPSTKPLGRRILVIPDTQVAPGVPLEHMTWAGRYIAAKRPDYIVHLGDHWDMPSLSSYDKGKRCFEGRRYEADIKAGNVAMDMLTREYRGLPGYAPAEHFLIGNHEQRIDRATQAQAELEGVIGYHHLNLAGWTVHGFLKVLALEGIKFSHFFTTGLMGRPVSSAAVLLRTAAGSAVMGHVQKMDMAVHEKTGAIALMAGVYYQHNEEYLGPQGNNCRRQLVMLNECRDGAFDPMFVSLDYLRHRYS